jgi:hypothetical protein
VRASALFTVSSRPTLQTPTSASDRVASSAVFTRAIVSTARSEKTLKTLLQALKITIKIIWCFYSGAAKTYPVSKEPWHAIALASDMVTSSPIVAVAESSAVHSPSAEWTFVGANIALKINTMSFKLWIITVWTIIYYYCNLNKYNCELLKNECNFKLSPPKLKTIS